MSGPSAVMATVCSKWALSEPSTVTAVQPSSSILTAAEPRLTWGSMAMTMPARRTGPRPGGPWCWTWGASCMLRPTPWPTKSRTTLMPCAFTCASIAAPRLADALEQRLLRHLDELASALRQGIEPADREAVRRIAHVAAIARRDVDFHQVTALQLARPGDAVHHLVVHGNADVAWIAEVPQRRGLRARFFEHARRDLVQVARGHARLGLLFEDANGFGHNPSRFAHDRDLARGLEHDRVVSRRFQMH